MAQRRVNVRRFSTTEAVRHGEEKKARSAKIFPHRLTPDKDARVADPANPHAGGAPGCDMRHPEMA